MASTRAAQFLLLCLLVSLAVAVGDGGKCSSNGQCSSGRCRGGRCCELDESESSCNACTDSGKCVFCSGCCVLEDPNDCGSSCESSGSRDSGQTCACDSNCKGSRKCRKYHCCREGYHNGCVDCDTGGNCRACSGGYYLSGGRCHAYKSLGQGCGSNGECSSGHCHGRCCKSSLSGNCNSCDSGGNCKSCTGSTFLSGGNCHAKRGAGSSCSANNWCNSNSCKGSRCCNGDGQHSNCNNCNSGGSCSSCTGSYFLDGGKCKAKRSAGSSCSANNWCSSNSCKGGRCCNGDGQHSNCNNCNSGGSCSSCTGSYFLSGGKCHAKRSDGSSCSANNWCTNNVCRGGVCCNGDGRHSNCNNCNGGGGACSSCTGSYFLSGGKCHPKRSDGSSCSAHDWCTNNVCRGGVCCNGDGRHSNCNNCNGGGGSCSFCTGSYFLSGGKCHAKRSDGSSCSANNWCTSNVCKGSRCCRSDRSSGCTSCNGGGGTCDACTWSTWYLHSGQCYTRKSPGGTCNANDWCQSPADCRNGYCCTSSRSGGCDSCGGGGGTCDSCTWSTWYLDGGQCYTRKNPGETCSANNWCQNPADCRNGRCCMSGRSSGCDSCGGGSGSCDTCVWSTHYLDGGQCYDRKDPGGTCNNNAWCKLPTADCRGGNCCTASQPPICNDCGGSGECVGCVAGHFLQAATCCLNSVSPHCSFCNNVGWCLACDHGWFLRGITCITSISSSMTISVTTSMSVSDSKSVTRSASLSMSVSHSVSESVSESSSRSQTASVSASETMSRSVTVSQSVSPSITSTTSQSISATVSASQSMSRSVSMSASATLSVSKSVTRSASLSMSVSQSVSESVSESSSRSETASVSSTVTTSQSVTVNQSVSPSLTSTVSQSVSATVSASQSMSRSVSVSTSATLSVSTSTSVSESISASSSITTSVSRSASVTVSQSSTQSISTSASVSESYSTTATITPPPTPTMTFSYSFTATASSSATGTVSASTSVSATASMSVSQSRSESSSVSMSSTTSQSSSLTQSNSVSTSQTVSTSMSQSQSQSVTSTLSSSTSTTASATTSLSFSQSSSATVSVSVSTTTTQSSSVTQSTSVSTSMSSSVSISESATASLSTSTSASMSETASLSISSSESASVSDSMSTSASLSISASLSTTESESMSVTESQSASISTSPTQSYTTSTSLSESIVPELPQLSVRSTNASNPFHNGTRSVQWESHQRYFITGVHADGRVVLFDKLLRTPVAELRPGAGLPNRTIIDFVPTMEGNGLVILFDGGVVAVLWVHLDALAVIEEEVAVYGDAFVAVHGGVAAAELVLVTHLGSIVVMDTKDPRGLATVFNATGGNDGSSKRQGAIPHPISGGITCRAGPFGSFAALWDAASGALTLMNLTETLATNGSVGLPPSRSLSGPLVGVTFARNCSLATAIQVDGHIIYVDVASGAVVESIVSEISAPITAHAVCANGDVALVVAPATAVSIVQLQSRTVRHALHGIPEAAAMIACRDEFGTEIVLIGGEHVSLLETERMIVTKSHRALHRREVERLSVDREGTSIAIVTTREVIILDPQLEVDAVLSADREAGLLSFDVVLAPQTASDPSVDGLHVSVEWSAPVTIRLGTNDSACTLSPPFVDCAFTRFAEKQSPRVITIVVTELPPYYLGPFVATVRMNMSNTNAIVEQRYMCDLTSGDIVREPTLPDGVDPFDLANVATPAPLQQRSPDLPSVRPAPRLAVRGIFGNDADGSTGIHFVVWTALAYGIITLVGQVVCRFVVKDSSCSVEDARWKFVARQHLWVSLVFPCHVRCHAIHTIGAYVSILGGYSVCIGALYFTGHSLVGWKRITFASIATAFGIPVGRAMLSYFFWSYKQVDVRLYGQLLRKMKSKVLIGWGNDGKRINERLQSGWEDMDLEEDVVCLDPFDPLNLAAIDALSLTEQFEEDEPSDEQPHLAEMFEDLNDIEPATPQAAATIQGGGDNLNLANIDAIDFAGINPHSQSHALDLDEGECEEDATPAAAVRANPSAAGQNDDLNLRAIDAIDFAEQQQTFSDLDLGEHEVKEQVAAMMCSANSRLRPSRGSTNEGPREVQASEAFRIDPAGNDIIDQLNLNDIDALSEFGSQTSTSDGPIGATRNMALADRRNKNPQRVSTISGQGLADISLRFESSILATAPIADNGSASKSHECGHFPTSSDAAETSESYRNTWELKEAPILVSRFRRAGYAFGAAFAVLLSLLILYWTSSWDDSDYEAFWVSMGCAIAGSFFVTEFIALGMAIALRWIGSPTEDHSNVFSLDDLLKQWHPFDGEIRPFDGNTVYSDEAKEVEATTPTQGSDQ